MRPKKVTMMKKDMGGSMSTINREALVCERNHIVVHRFEGIFKGVYRLEKSSSRLKDKRPSQTFVKKGGWMIFCCCSL